MIKLKKRKNQIVVMVDAAKLGNLLIRIILIVVIYFAIVDIVIYFTYGIAFTPREWLLNPLYNLIQLNPLAWLTLVGSIIIGVFLVEIRKKQ